MTLQAHTSSARTMQLLGYAGLLPFVGLLLLSAVAPAEWSDRAGQSLLVYAAMILTFLGAVHWGWVLSSNTTSTGDTMRLVWAVTPSLVGWIALMMPIALATITLAASFVLCWWLDQKWLSADALAWYRRLRLHLSVVVVLTLLVSLVV